jgi:hypothetical protein
MQQPPWNAGPKGLPADRRLSARRRLGDAGQHRAHRSSTPTGSRTGTPQQRPCVSSPCDLDHDILQSAPFADADSPTPAGAASPGASDPNRPNALDAASATPTDALGPARPAPARPGGLLLTIGLGTSCRSITPTRCSNRLKGAAPRWRRALLLVPRCDSRLKRGSQPPPRCRDRL